VTVIPSSMPTIYSGWPNYQGLLTASLSGLTPDQLALSAAPGLWAKAAMVPRSMPRNPPGTAEP